MIHICITEANRVAKMAGFIGKEIHAVDEKGRLMIPVRFRRKFGRPVEDGSAECVAGPVEELYIMKAPDRSIELYEPFVWSGIRKTISALSDFNPEERLLKTLMYESLEIVTLDRQGRIALSREFLDHAGISGDVVIIGADTKMTVWDPKQLSTVLQESSGRMASLAGRYF
ncbi:MraZ protein [Chlorobium ferrooxidans DSM 13031]|uniref:Transcriptional regulator MraZ n=2 Tax=Chlorobium/Pelodictyon group TaxID=274493 RepID=Q0YPV0_9CHLB|nr:MraZ protein [Chlorobium ferrooxidans DSM 13031]